MPAPGTDIVYPAQDYAPYRVARPRYLISIPALLAFIALAALILDPLFGSVAALVFLAAGGLLMISKPERTLRALIGSWYVMIVPGYCVLSVLWSQYPALSLRYGIQLALTAAIAIVIANRVKPLTFFHCLFGIYSIGVVGSVLFGRVRDDIGAWVGIFGSKNAFAGAVSGFALASLALTFDRSVPRALRLCALGGLVLSGPLLLKAQSAGAILFTFPAICIAIAILFSKRMTSGQKITVVGFVLVVGAMVVMALLGLSDFFFDLLLEYTGKDATLTGRTDLWEYAFQSIREQPWLGLGYQAFWVQDYGPAEVLWAMFGIESRYGFNFHNTYISNAVELGLIGVTLQIVLFYSAVFLTLRRALRKPVSENAFLAAFIVSILCSSFTEAVFFFQFSIATVVVICALVYSSRAMEDDA